MRRNIVLMLFLLFSSAVVFSDPIDTFRLDHLTISDGLPHSSVSKILQDSNGFMWIGTQSGLTRYDGYNFTTYLNNPFDSNSLPHNLVQTMFLDDDDVLWLGTYNGLSKMDINSDTFSNFSNISANENSLSDEVVVAIERDKMGKLWIGTLDGLNLMDEESGTFRRFFHDPDDPDSLPDNTVRSIFNDAKGNLWIGTYGGLCRWDYEKERFITYTCSEDEISDELNRYKDSLKSQSVSDERSDEEILQSLGLDLDTNSIPSNYVMDIKQSPESDDIIIIGTWKGQSSPGGIAEFNTITESIVRYSLPDMRVYTLLTDDRKRLWVGTWGGGLSILSLIDDGLSHFVQGNSSELSSNVVYSLFQDISGVVWIGTNGGGIDKYIDWKNQYQFLVNDSSDPSSLPAGKIVSALEDSRSRLWFAAQGNGLSLYDRKSNSFKNFSHDEEDKTSLSNSMVNVIYEDSTQNLWVGTNNGLNRFIDEDSGFEIFNTDEEGASLPENLIYAIIEDNEGNLWLGSYTRGISVLDGKTGKFKYYRNDKDDPNSLSDNLIRNFFVDSSGNIWISTNKGLNLYLPESDSFRHYVHDVNDISSISSDDVRAVFEDSEGYLWISTSGGGVNLYNADSDSFSHISTLDGLHNNTVYGIEEDLNGNLLFITQSGISIFNRNEDSFTYIDEKTGLLSSELTSGYLKASDGSFFIGSDRGLTHIPYFSEEYFQYTPMIHINGLSVLGVPFDNGNIPIWKTDEITLEYQQNILTFEFALSDYSSAGQNQFAYFLEGVDSSWVHTGTRHFARYTELDPGNYTFRVIGADSRNNWNNRGTSLKITILPPIWETTTSYIVYFILLLLFLSLIIIRIKRKSTETKEKIEEQKSLNLELERRVLRRTAEIEEARNIAEKATKAKSIFLANMSHELRTPLNAVIGFSALLNEDELSPEKKYIINSIKTAGKSLSTLINDLLDLSKMEAGKMSIKMAPVHIATVLFELQHIFGLRTKEKNLSFHIELDPELPSDLILDETRFRQILINLVGNSIKFTDSGYIQIKVEKLPEQKKNLLDMRLTVEDSGCGISEEDKKKVFDLFWQREDALNLKPTGTGLGLSITRNLINLMNGEIDIQSTPGMGTSFVAVFHDIAISEVKSFRKNLSNSDQVNNVDQLYNNSSILKRGELIRELTALESRWKELKLTGRMSILEDFGKCIQEIGIRYNARMITDYSENLLTYMKLFDLSQIEIELARYPQIIEALNK